MSATIAIVPASGSVISVVSACRITVSGASTNDPTTYDPADIPTEEAFTYRLVGSLAGQQDLVSVEFQVGSTGSWVWDNVIFPAAGVWTLDLVDQSDDGVTATLAVTVS
jgi:hypothetical protein